MCFFMKKKTHRANYRAKKLKILVILGASIPKVLLDQALNIRSNKSCIAPVFDLYSI